MMKYIKVLLVICIGMYACAPVKYVKPLEKRQQAASLSLGGPLISFAGAVIPMPFITANYGHGIDSSLTGFASVNVTSALYGNAQVELGITKQLLKQNGYMPALSVTPVANVIYRNKDARKLYPQLALNAFWEYGKHKNVLYAGIDNWFELAQKRVFDVTQQNHWIWMPTVGHNFTREKWNFNIEAKIIAPNLSNQKLVVHYVTPFGTHGAMGVYFGCVRKF